jgi:hypothetical protein
MRYVLALLLLFTAGAARAQSPDDAAAIQSVINQQIEAFRHDDAPGAFGFAAPVIQEMYGSSGRFMAMVSHAYPPVYRPREVEFTDLVTIGGQLVQKVELVGPDGRRYLALYAMEKQPDGSWKISGCQLTESESVGA